MERRNNYLIQAAQAKQYFLTYDQEKLIRKLKLEADENYIYANLLCKQYRLSRTTGDLECRGEDGWMDGNSFDEVMTLLDLICDSREDRSLTGKWGSMESFGLQFHQNLLQESRDPFAERIDGQPDVFENACIALNGEKVPGADMGYAIELFDGLKIAVLFWHGDEEFAPRIRYLWDENALQYIRYETMYFALGLLRRRLTEKMTPAE